MLKHIYICLDVESGVFHMNENSGPFEQWLLATYKLSTANRIYQTVLEADTFLKETSGGPKASLFDKSAICVCQRLDALRQNKVFRFKFKSLAASLPEAIRAVREYANEHMDEPLYADLQKSAVVESIKEETQSDVHPAGESIEHNSTSADDAPVSDESAILQDALKTEDEMPAVPTEVLLHEDAEITHEQPVRLFDSVLQDNPKAQWQMNGVYFEIANHLGEFREEPPQGIDVNNMGTAEIMQHILERCMIKLDDKTISQGEIQKNYAAFLSQTAEHSKHNVGIVLHSGSIIFEALAVLYAAVSNLIRNETSPEEIVRSLMPGDLVLLHEKKETQRWRFEGFAREDGREYAILLQEKTSNVTGKSRDKFWVRREDWGRIEPYNGQSQMLDGRGIKKHSRERKDFFKTVLNIAEKDIPSITDTSTVIVLSRNRADYLVDKLTLCFAEREIRLLDLVTASYYTENSEYYYIGNTGKNDPVLKFVSKVSVARQKILQKDGNRNIGLLVFGDDVLGHSKSELPELINRKSLRYVFLFVHVDSENAALLVDENEDAELFALTKETLENCTRKDCFNTYTKELYQQIYAIRNRSTRTDSVEGPWTWEQRRQLTKYIHIVKESAFESREKEDFIMYAWSLMRLFETSCFSMQKMDELASRNMLPVLGVAERLKLLKGLIQNFTSDITIAAENIWSILETGYQALLVANPKEERLKQILQENKGKKICVVVPKAYHTAIVQKSKIADLLMDSRLLTVVTANRFDKTALYDLIIVTGDFSSNRFDALQCFSAIEIVTLLYPSEHSFWQKRLSKVRRIQRMYNSRSVLLDEGLRVAWKQEENVTDTFEDKHALYERETQDIDQFLVQLNEKIMWGQISSSASSRSSVDVDITAVLTFDTGERAFLTQNYKAYVIKANADAAEVVEKKPADLVEGDSIVFTKNDDATHDLVDDVFQQLLQENALPQIAKENHMMSKRWKDILHAYMEEHHFKARHLARAMKKAGLAVEEQTIVNWLDPYVRTICPRDVESLRQIGMFTDDIVLKDSPEQIYNAGREVKRIRKMILKKIGQMIVDKMSGREKPADGSVWDRIYDRIDAMADVMLIDSIVTVERKIPANYTNRPISREE